MQQLPKQLTFEQIRPKGFISEFKEWPVDPMSSNAYWAPNEIVRFLLTLDQGWMDPFRSYFQIEVQVDPALGIGGLQVDSSAQSFINQLVISSNSVEVQRIPEYDTLACLLTDLGFSQTVSQGRDLQGMGSSQWSASQSNRFPRGAQASTFGFNNSNNNYTTMGAENTISPTRAFMGATVGSVSPLWQQDGQWRWQGGFSGAQVAVTSAWCANANNVDLVQTFAGGAISNIRSEYLGMLADDKYPQAPLSINKNGVEVRDTNIPGAPYNVFLPELVTPFRRGGISNSCSNMGYNTAYSPYTTRGVYEPLISNNIPQAWMRNGLLRPQPMPVRRRTFLIPVLSAVVGVLIPPEQYKLLPLKSLMNLLVQITLNPYAMFSTGYQDKFQFDATGMSRPIPRAFRITKFQWILNIYNFPSEAIRNYLQGSIARGIAITCSSWMLGSQYQIPNGQLVRNNWQVNSTAQSLAEILIVFLTNDYQRWPFCRKQFRLSNNITSMQLKFNTNYFPPQPIIGNAGNPEPVEGDPDNANYYLLLLKSNNFLFSVNTPLPRINRVNFAINDRIYDPSDQRTFAPISFRNTGQSGSDFGPDVFNYNTALGQPWFHENRWIGKAAYCYSFQPFAHSKEYTMGIDSRQARPFEVLLNASPSGYFRRDQTMYIFLRHNIIVVYTDKGVMVSGR